MPCSFACYFYLSSQIGDKFWKLMASKAVWLQDELKSYTLRRSLLVPTSVFTSFWVYYPGVSNASEYIHEPSPHISRLSSHPTRKSPSISTGRKLGVRRVVHHPYFVEETEAQCSATCFKVTEAISWRKDQWNPISTEATLFVCWEWQNLGLPDWKCSQ